MPAVTLFVRRLPATATNENLTEVFSEIGPLKNCFVVRDRETEKCRGFGYVTFSMEDDAQRAIKEVREYDGEKIFVTVAKKKPDNKKKKKKVKTEGDSEDKKNPKHEPTETKRPAKSTGIKKNKLKARLIIRNLSFKCEEDDLKQIFSEFGTVMDAKIPLKPDGKKRGFAFVQFKNMAEAGKALAAMNLKEIKDRQVAVDWAIAKDKYLANQSAGAAGTIKEENVNSKGAGADGKEKEAKKKPTLQEEKDDSESEEEEGSEDDDDDEANSSEADDAENYSESQQTDSDASEPEDDDDDDDDSDDAEGKTPPKKKRDPLPSDVNEGRTIFIRNLAFDTDEEGLEEVLLQFGELKYVRVVMSVDTGYSKGCAFAQFKSKEVADKCIAAAAEDEKEFGGIRVDGRRLNVLPAVNREDATKFKDKKVKTHTGSRNLYLAREGLIRPGSKSAEGVSETDLAKRTRFEELKRAKLKDMNIYVSKTRLCVHNLPKNVDQQKLQKLCLSAAGGKGVRITECRVMYDKKPIHGQVIGKSLGYGFVAFNEHEHALQALRHLNNNPDIVGPQKRPIVEFSLEDGRKLKLKAIRLENSKKQLKKGSSQKGEQLPQQHSGKKKGPLRKGNAANVVKQEKEQGSQYSGFMTKPEVEHVELKDGKKRPKVLHMPSHRGPKIRKRDKGKQPMVQPKKQKKVPSRKERKGPTFIEKSSTNRKPNTKPAKLKFQNREDVRFDTLVNRYKKKLMGTSNTKTAVKKSKWFS
ncbi:RNA-binding protein 28-like [Sinocyclocheilus anshuiensis]|uniref:RNA-binding protein 28-like n=1 Tax=Sinocyclocheilus anshuiensis TaxID=1608454 RepID=A0A671SGQ9_9TELE|nr:PREDICTED: RNA-binding protein 28-like [Sinocyclocheilus anshuiensis]